jgi:hypothetical protein
MFFWFMVNLSELTYNVSALAHNTQEVDLINSED